MPPVRLPRIVPRQLLTSLAMPLTVIVTYWRSRSFLWMSSHTRNTFKFPPWAAKRASGQLVHQAQLWLQRQATDQQLVVHQQVVFYRRRRASSTRALKICSRTQIHSGAPFLEALSEQIRNLNSPYLGSLLSAAKTLQG